MGIGTSNPTEIIATLLSGHGSLALPS
jgi:hypothetical protein